MANSPKQIPDVLEKLRRKEQVTIVALGDSNTELTWHSQGRLNWLGLLQVGLFEIYGNNLAFTINAGKCGASAVGSLNRIDRDVVRWKPDLVIISFGMNDAGGGSAKLDEFADAMRMIVRELRERCGCAILLRTSNPIVVPLQPDLPKGYTIGLEMPGKHQGLYAKRTVELARELDCAVVDHYALWTQAENRDKQLKLEQPCNHLWMRMSDAIHPGPLGHQIFYRELAPLFGLPTHFAWEE